VPVQKDPRDGKWRWSRDQLFEMRGYATRDRPADFPANLSEILADPESKAQWMREVDGSRSFHCFMCASSRALARAVSLMEAAALLAPSAAWLRVLGVLPLLSCASLIIVLVLCRDVRTPSSGRVRVGAQQTGRARGGRTTRYQQPPPSPNNFGPVVPLTRSEDRWVPGKGLSHPFLIKLGRERVGVGVNSELDRVKKRLLGLLNKMTLEKFDTLTVQMVDVITSEGASPDSLQ